MRESLRQRYDRDGFVSGVPILSMHEAQHHRRLLEAAEDRLGPLHYQAKIHTLLQTAWELSSHPGVLDVVTSLIGPDVLLHGAMYIIKEPNSASHVSWHQDLTYWGFNDDKQVSMWLALSTTNSESGSMIFLPGTHKQGTRDHEVTDDPDNVLYQGQTIRNVDESRAVLSVLQPGEASFHHGWVMHSSTANQSDDRRIGLNVQYIAPSMRQTKHDRDTAILVAGKDDYGHFVADSPPRDQIDEAAFARQQELNRQYREIAGSE